MQRSLWEQPFFQFQTYFLSIYTNVERVYKIGAAKIQSSNSTKLSGANRLGLQELASSEFSKLICTILAKTRISTHTSLLSSSHARPPRSVSTPWPHHCKAAFTMAGVGWNCELVTQCQHIRMPGFPSVLQSPLPARLTPQCTGSPKTATHQASLSLSSQLPNHLFLVLVSLSVRDSSPSELSRCRSNTTSCRSFFNKTPARTDSSSPFLMPCNAYKYSLYIQLGILLRIICIFSAPNLWAYARSPQLKCNTY